MNFEREYYENPFFWDPTNTREEDLERIGAVVGLIPENVASLLDVGCGNGLFVHHLLEVGRPLERLHATDRSVTALKHVQAEKTLAEISGLPFSDRSFDLVSCQEVVEHLPVPVFEEALSELCRVSERFVLISVPYLEDLEKTLVACPSCRTLFNPYRHLRSFSESVLRNLFTARGFVCVALHPLGTAAHMRGVDWVLMLRRSRPGRCSPYAVAIPCAACGFMLPPAGGSGKNAAGVRRLDPGLRGLIKALWPKRIKPVRMAALYKRGQS